MNEGDFLYIQLAEKLEDLITDEILKIGDKLPSVRRLSEEQQVSMSTAFQAYYHLESKGLIESRPKSGYYVKFNPKIIRKLPQIQPLRKEEGKTTFSEMIATCFKNASQENILKLSSSAPHPSLIPIAKLKKSVQHALQFDAGVNYADIRGVKELRTQLAKLSLNWGGVMNEDELIVTSGCMEALVMCLKSVTKPGDKVAIDSPTYFGIFQVIESLGLTPVEVLCHPNEGIDLDYLKEVLLADPEITACLFVPTNTNPVGSVLPDDKKEQLVVLLEQLNIPLIEDDIYGELFFGKHRPKTCKSFDRTGNVLYCSSLSKSLAPGYRIGWTIPGKHYDKVLNHKSMHSVAVNTLSQYAMAHFLEKGRYSFHLKKLRKDLHANYLRYLQAFQLYFPSSIKLSQPSGGYVIWLQMDECIDGIDLYEKVIVEGISISPGQLFSFKGNYKNYVRMSFSSPWSDEVEMGMKKIGSILQKMVEKHEKVSQNS